MVSSPPPALLDHLLRAAPLDVLLFDTELVCRYAALVDDTLLGRTEAELVGQSASTLFPSGADDLMSALELAAASASSYHYNAYRYTHHQPATETLYCWSVRVEPVVLHDYRGREEFRGVLVTLADIHDLVDQRDRLQAENERLRQQLAAAEEQVALDRMASQRLREAVRNALTPATGYLQVISRRPQVLGGRPVAQVIDQRVLPSLQQAINAVDDAVNRRRSHMQPDGDFSTDGSAEQG